MGNTQIEITRWPVLIYANYRTGSNVLGSIIANKYSAKWYPEPLRDKIRYENFIKHYYSDDKNYIVKFMPDQKDKIKETLELYQSDCFKIKLTRKNKLDQLVSYYIAAMRDQWVQSHAVVEDYFLDFNLEVLERVASVIKENDQLLYEDTTVFDYTLDYEDLDFDNGLSDYHKITPPKNIEILKNIIKRHYEQG